MAAVLRVALTGGIGSGKTTVSSKFQEIGVPVIDTDIIARDIVEAGEPCYEKIVNVFGKNILNKNKSLNRGKLRDIVFKNSAKKKILEEILHPAIYEEIDKQISKVVDPYCLIVIPLLIETNAADNFDRVLVVDTSETLQIERASSRDKLSTESIRDIIKSQVSRELRLKYATEIINNSLTIEELNETIQQLHEKYTKLSSQIAEN